MNAPALNDKITAPDFLAWLAGQADTEAHLTEQTAKDGGNDGTLADYIADLIARFARMSDPDDTLYLGIRETYAVHLGVVADGATPDSLTGAARDIAERITTMEPELSARADGDAWDAWGETDEDNLRRGAHLIIEFTTREPETADLAFKAIETARYAVERYQDTRCENDPTLITLDGTAILTTAADHSGVIDTNIIRQTWTFVGHWDDADEIEVEYVVPGEYQDPREDTGYWPGGLFAAPGTGTTKAEALAAVRAEYENHDEDGD